jgi:ubiquinone/menaquinone biosynthesis C-methylase UbiE
MKLNQYMKLRQRNLKPGFIVQNKRQLKALKILKIIEDAGKSRNLSIKLLDIGTGNGEIASFLSEYFDVTSVDIIDQRSQSIGFSFELVDNEILPFKESEFDIVISNHAIEHLSNADLHLAEISRVIKPDGLVYLATPNRFWPWEVHYQLLFLHYFPQPVFMAILKRIGKYHEELNLVSWFCLKHKLQKHFAITVMSDVICKWPQKYYFDVGHNIASILSWIPLWVYRAFTFINPTLIILLKPKALEEIN